MRPLSLLFFGLGALLLVLASLGRFQSAELVPWIFGPALAVAAAAYLIVRRRSLSRAQISLLIAGFLLAASAPVGQLVRGRAVRASWQRAALAAFDAEGMPPLVFEHVVNDPGRTLPDDPRTGAITVLNFWATWCSPCVKEMPLLEAFSRSHDPAVARVVGFTRFYGENDEVSRREELGRIEQALRKNGVTYPSLVARESTTHVSYQVHGLPTTILIGTDGKILDYGVGVAGTKRLLDRAHRLATDPSA